MKRTLRGALASAACALALAAAAAWAGPADRPAGRTAVVDLQKIIAVSRRGQRAREKFKDTVLSRQKEVDKYRAELEQLEKDYRDKSETFSGKERDAYEGRFRARVTELKRKGEDIREDLEREQKKLTDAIVDDVQRLAQVFARKQGYSLVIEARSVEGGFVAPAADVTQAILDIYDAEAGREEKKK